MLDKYHLNYLYIGEILLALSIIIDVKAPIYSTNYFLLDRDGSMNQVGSDSYFRLLEKYY